MALLAKSLIVAALMWSFNAPTTRTDGTPLSLEEIAGYEVYLDGVLQPDLIAANVTAIEYPSLDQGCIAMRTVDTDGRKSEKTLDVCKSDGYVPLPPLPPDDVDIPTDKWTVEHVSSYEIDNWLMRGEYAFNRGDPTEHALWHSRYTPTEALPPHELQVDMQATYRVTAFSQKPRTGAGNATVKDYIFYLSEDGVTFTEVARGSFAPGDQLHTVEIAPTAARYWSFVALSEQDGGNQASTDEIFLRGSPIVAPARPSPPVMVE
jgi:hypothetical protein